MAYNTQDLIDRAIEILNNPKNHVVFIEDLAMLLGISKQTLYEHKLDEMDVISNKLQNNKIAMKNGLRKQWYVSDNATKQLALYKLLGDTDELNRLNNQPITNITNNIELSKEQILEIAKQMIIENPELKAEIQKELE